MPTCGMAILTRGMTYPPSRIDVVVCDKPTLQAVVEVRPAIRGIVPPPIIGPPGVPQVLAASSVRPQIRRTKGPEQQPPADEPKVLSSKDLRPVIRKAEEEE